MNVTMTVTINETEARRLWERCCEEQGGPPLGQGLADWLAEFCETTIESNFQFDASVAPEVDAQCTSVTVALLKELGALDNLIDENSPKIHAAEVHRAVILAQLVDAEQSEQQLEALRTAYAPLLNPAPTEESAAR